MEYQHERQNVQLVVYHISWCPKRRRQVVVGPLRTRVEQVMREVVADPEWTVLELAIQPEHVHLFVRADPYTLPSAIPRLIKGRRAHDLRAEFPPLLKLPSRWTRSLLLSTAGTLSHETMRQYLERQRRT